MDLVREVNFCISYSFKYSERPGTPAAEMFGQVPEEVKTERLHRLQALLWEQQTAFNKSKIGETVSVLVTGKGRMPGQMAGRSPWLQSVYFDGDESLNGQVVDLKINHATQNSISGDLVGAKEVAV
jgi:tRNA-2-methylthio-N6-dimethylallyladenosine synthase